MKIITAVYAGSFDPVTRGHLDIIHRAASVFSNLIVAVGQNSAKQHVFTPEERVELIRQELPHLNNVKVVSFSGLLVDLCHDVGATVIVRGLRSVTDFIEELALAHVNEQLDEIDTVFFTTRPEHSFISSTVARELVRHGRDATAYVPVHVAEAMKKKMEG